jgi:hypothetical protein
VGFRQRLAHRPEGLHGEPEGLPCDRAREAADGRESAVGPKTLNEQIDPKNGITHEKYERSSSFAYILKVAFL